MTGAPRAPSAEAVQTFASALTSARAARQWIEPLLDRWAVGKASGDILLVVSELVTNAVLHGAGPVRLRLERRVDGVRVEVSDDGEGAVAPRTPDLAAVGGRGLMVVGRLAGSWGVDQRSPVGKTVWAELAVPA
jgi:anti-sigma regulatory factor (Ser/Thr protein kinase)